MKYQDISTNALVMNVPVTTRREPIKTASLNQNLNKPTGAKPMPKQREVVTTEAAVQFVIDRYKLDASLKQGLIDQVARAITKGIVESPDKQAKPFENAAKRKVYADSVVSFLAAHG